MIRDLLASLLGWPPAVSGPWFNVATKPPLHSQVLIELRTSVGPIYDVACYIGSQDDGEGGKVERWILADVRLESRQIKRWAAIA